MPEFRNLKKVLQQWGGTTGTFFAYTHFSHDLCIGLLVALLPLIREDFGLNYLQSGLLVSAYTIASGFSQLLGGWLGDRFRREVVIAIGIGGVGLAALAVGLSPAYYPMLVILVIMGIFAGAYHPSATPMLSSHFEEARRGKVLAVHMVGGSMGFAIGPVLGGLIGGVLGWRFAFILLTIPALVAVPLVLKKLRQQVNGGKVSSGASTNDSTSIKPTHRLFGIGRALRPIAVVIILTILMQLVVGCATSFIPIYLVDKHNIAPAYAAMFMGVIRGGGVVGSLFGGWLSDRWGRKNVIFLALVAAGPILYLLTKLPFNAALIVFFVLFGIVVYMRTPAIQALLMDSTPPQLRATVLGIYLGLAMEGRSLVQPIAGHFMDALGIAQVFNIIALISITLSLVALIWAIKLSRKDLS